MEPSKTDRQNRIILFGVLGVIVILAILSYVHNVQPVTPIQVATSTIDNSGDTATSITAVFNCDSKKSVTAIFSHNRVDLDLSDGRHISLGQAISASGARYATADESFVFWNKGNTAFITEHGTATYNNCITQ